VRESGTSHKSLDKTKHQIRLFKFDPDYSISVSQRAFELQCRSQPGRVQVNDISGTLEIFDLERSPRFHALSYEWAKRYMSHKILVDGKELDISINLYSFLMAYRHNRQRHASSSVVKYIWADQICIAQKDTEERNHQVGLMGRIFITAFRVIAWFGEDPDLMLLFERVERGVRLLLSNGRLPLDELQRARDAFHSSSFWSRLWIQQELVLSKHVLFAVGSFFLGSRDLLAENLGISMLAEREPSLRCKLEQRSASSTTFGLLDAINMFSSKACSDPRDKVYGLQGMVWPLERVTIDYSLSVADVFRSTIDKVLGNGHPHWRTHREMMSWTSMASLGHQLGLDPELAKGIYQDSCDERFDLTFN
jgi:hypothetical protein